LSSLVPFVPAFAWKGTRNISRKQCFSARTYSGTQLMRTGKLVYVRSRACASGLYVFDLEAKTEHEGTENHVFRKERKLLLVR
jgi:hypothetical protein